MLRYLHYLRCHRLHRPVDPKVKEFLRYILSSEGQTQVMRDGKYLPLTADTVRAQLKLLE